MEFGLQRVVPMTVDRAARDVMAGYVPGKSHTK